MSAAQPEAGIDAIRLDGRDAVATALRALSAGEAVRVQTPDGPLTLTAAEDIPLCHKLALEPIAKGDPIRKYGEVIGAASAAIAAGALVHVHNLESLRGRG